MLWPWQITRKQIPMAGCRANPFSLKHIHWNLKRSTLHLSGCMQWYDPLDTPWYRQFEATPALYNQRLRYCQKLPPIDMMSSPALSSFHSLIESTPPQLMPDVLLNWAVFFPLQVLLGPSWSCCSLLHVALCVYDSAGSSSGLALGVTLGSKPCTLFKIIVLLMTSFP